jgi:hypothetical protein
LAALRHERGFGNAPPVLALAMPTAMTFIFVVIIAVVPMPGFWRRRVMAFTLRVLAVDNSIVPGEVLGLNPAMAVVGST